MADPRDDIPDGFDPEETPAQADEGAGQELWRLLQEQGRLAGGEAGVPVEPAHVQPFPEQPEDHLAAEEMDQWRRFAGASTEIEDSERASRLRRLIDTPEAMAAEGYEVETARSPTRGDMDAAIANYNMTQSIACRNHPEEQSVGQCPQCQAFYCQDCLTIRRGKMLCRDCADASFVLSEEEVIRAQEEGRDAEVGVAAEIPPEFQLGSFGIEGAPAGTLKKLLALVLDFGLTKLLLLSVVWLGWMLNLDFIPEAARQVFEPDSGEGGLLGKVVAGITTTPLAWLPLMGGIDFLYFFTTQSFFNRTIGMGWVGSRIVTEWGEFVSFGAAALRSLVYVASFQLPAVLVSLFTPNHRGLHDLVAGTLEINYSGVKRVDAYETVQIQL